MTLLSLADRVEAASGPDRELDGEIDRLLHNRPKDGDYCEKENALWRVKDAWSGLLVRTDGFARGSFCAREYTASLDAALTLVPEGVAWTLDGGNPSCYDSASLGPIPASGELLNPLWFGNAATPALALAAASLRAIAHQKDKG